MPGPRQVTGDVLRGPRAGGERLDAQLEAYVVVREQLVDPGVRRRRDRAVRRQDPQVGQATRTLVSEARKSPSGCAVSGTVKPMDGVIVGSTWSPANSSPSARSANT